MVPKILVIHILWCGIVFPGCAERYVTQRSTEELIELVGDRDQADRIRLGVLTEVSGRPLTEEQREKLGDHLVQVVTSPLHSPMIRQQVIDMIATRYPKKAPVWLSETLIETREPALRTQILKYLEQFDDTRALPGLIIALSEEEWDTNMPTLRRGLAPDRGKITPKLEDSLGGATQRMFMQGAGMTPMFTAETAVARVTVEGVITRIADDSLENILASYLFDKERATLRVRNAALLSLVRISGKEKVKQLLSSAGSDDAFLKPLCFWAEHFDYVPQTKSQVLMCQMQWLRLTVEQKENLQQRVRSLREREGYWFQITDSHILLEAEKTLIAKSADMLTSVICKRLQAVEHTKRSASYAGAADDYREDFTGQCKSLLYTDLLRIFLLLEYMQQQENQEILRLILRKDLRDVETEVGGLSFMQKGKMEFREYPPQQRLGDNQYHESSEMIADGVLCLTRWHCHVDPHQTRTAQADEGESQYTIKEEKGPFGSGRWKGAALAGPGVDDMEYVKFHGCPLVVVTYLDPDTFNMDYVSAQGIVIDLGNY